VLACEENAKHFKNGKRGKHSKALGEGSPCAAPGHSEISGEDSLMVSGSIAYHSLLAIFPLLLLLLGLSGYYIRRFELAGHLSVVLQRYLPIRTDIIMQNLVGISRAYGRIGLSRFCFSCGVPREYSCPWKKP
jgi:hypothetical protein